MGTLRGVVSQGGSATFWDVLLLDIGKALLERGGSSACAHDWMRAHSECPYGWAGPGDVTFPDYDKARRMHVAVDAEYDESQFFLYIWVLYSYVPCLVALVAAAKLLWPCRGVCPSHGARSRGTRELAFGLLFVVIIGANELLIKPFVKQPRPEMSCVSTCGMPSSHSALASGMLIMGLLDFALRATPRRYVSGCTPAPVADPEPDGPRARLLRSGRRWLARAWYDQLFSLQLATFDEPSTRQLLVYAVFFVVLMLPVPLSRVQLSDHTPTQAALGVIVGAAAAVPWYFFVYGRLKRYNHCLGKRWPQGWRLALEHNLSLPCCMALERCNPHSLRPRQGYSQRFARTPDDPVPFRWLQECIEELSWYKRETTLRRDEMFRKRILTTLEEHYLKVRERSISDLIELLSFERWVLQTAQARGLPSDVTEAFLARAASPAPRGLGLQSKRAFAALRPDELAPRMGSPEVRAIAEALHPCCKASLEAARECAAAGEAVTAPLPTAEAEERAAAELEGGLQGGLRDCRATEVEMSGLQSTIRAQQSRISQLEAAVLEKEEEISRLRGER
mmetsp:Transcript_85936/g.267012  ORF Transcript_85936/g.267012 Transcript_85936/m.267012 type:complete len:564 (+) Transcript_85936:75-1766(+)